MLGGAGLGVAVDTPYPGPATEYARFVVSADIQGGLYIENEGQPGSLVALRRSRADLRQTNFCQTLAHALEDCYTRPTYPGWIGVENGADHELSAFLDGQCEADAVLVRLMELASETLEK
jgi:multiple sugar transport system substrate-binding protein